MALKEIFEQNTADIALATELLKVLNDRAGQYVWKKYGGITVQLTQMTIGGSPTVFRVSGEGMDFSNINNLIGLVFSDNYGHILEITSATSIRHTDTSGGVTTYTLTWDSAKQTFSFPVSWSSTHVFEEIKNPENYVNDYVVSDDPTAYPDGGEQDGYWYELVSEGVSGIDYGTITLSSSIETITISHGLNELPSIGIILKIPYEASSTQSTINANGNYQYAGQTITGKVTKTTTELKFTNSTYKFKAGTYYWFAIV